MDETINNAPGELSPEDPKHWSYLERKSNYTIVVQLVVASIGWVFTLLSIFVIKDYGEGLFIAIPFIIAALPAYLVTAKFQGTTYGTAFWVAFKSLIICSLGIVVFAIEGIICVFMAAPFAVIIAIFGAALGHYLGQRKNEYDKSVKAMSFVFAPLLLFILSFVPSTPKTYQVVTTIEIDAPPAVVWNNVVQFTTLPKPDEWIFKTGIAYPINAKIEGKGVGAVRRCNFTTGSFVEPITVWDEPHLLAFDVLEQPEPMKELSPYDIQPAHLHGYFLSEHGQFKLTDLGNGKTMLEGTTWYHHKISPEFYWHLWSNEIIHAIHNRVLKHIKTESEKQG